MSTGARLVTDQRRATWTHPSVLALKSKTDPVETITHEARRAVFEAIQVGWTGPPYNPFALAEILKISVEPRQDVIDARTVCGPGGKFRIEFNPSRSEARINFSVAHEIAHTLFPDCGQAIRNRYTHADMKANDWELEVLCNIGAAEILMPVGSFHPSEDKPTSIDDVTTLQREFLVSTEAVLLRIAKLTSQRCFVFAAHKDEKTHDSTYRIEYSVSSRTWPVAPFTGFRLPIATAVADCKAIGFTSKRDEEWVPGQGIWRVECLGIAPFHGYVNPRVVGIVRPAVDGSAKSERIEMVRGTAIEPRGSGPRIIVQVVNDKAITWRGAFATTVREHWPAAQKDYTEWIFAKRSEFHLGAVHRARLTDSLELASLVAQHGYGPSLFPRIQYAALEECLQEVANWAKHSGATVHMPRIGCGEAKGDWNIVSELIDETLCRNGIHVTVYDLPGTPTKAKYSRS